MLSGGGLGLRQVDRHAAREQRRRHHEDDEQHQHHVDERRHVDVGHGAVARHAAPPAPALVPRRRTDMPMACAPSVRASGRAVALAADVLVDLARQDRGELVGEALHAGLVLGHDALQIVEEDQRRNGREQADRGGEQRLGEARAR